MAEALVTIAAEGILKKVLLIAAGELAVAWGYEEKLRSLHETLDMIRAKLRDAERQKGTEVVMVWLKQLKDVVGEANDVLDEVHYEMLRRQIKKSDRSSRLCLPSLKRFTFRNEIGHKIDKINETLLKIDTRAHGLGLQGERSAGLVSDRLYWRETVPHLKVKIIGRDADKQRIIVLLTQSRTEEELTIVPIVGMGGIGKTALANSVYIDKKVEQYFDVRAWLCVSVKADIVTLLAKIYESLAGRKPASVQKPNLIERLKEELASKRYLLVLDDVWDEERPYWEDFRSDMLDVNSKNGSVILVTTRKRDIGTPGMRMDSFPIDGLSDGHCWDIFRERAFVEGKSPSPELEEIGREIAKKCGGLPLLLNVTGGMLANYDDKEKWLSIKNSNVWDLEEERERVQKSLELSFDNLPNSTVKQCFAYCSIFKKDTLMEREEVIQFWMALGLVQADESRNKEMEDVGDDIFQILVSNSLFQEVERHEYGRHITGCSMHDLVHDLSLSLSKCESFSAVGATKADIARIPQVKHLAFYQKQYLYGDLKISMFIENHRTLQTLFFTGEVEKNFSFQRFKCMRILKLYGYSLDKLHDSIGELVHLRYLDVSETSITVLPESIGKLYHLLTLKLQLYYDITKFPKAMRNLTSLRYCNLSENIPYDIVGHLICLRNLHSFRVPRRKGDGIEVLRHLNNLSGSLCISYLENISRKEDVVKADLASKKKLKEIEYKWSQIDEGANRNDEDVLEGLQPPRDVKVLKIENFSSDNFPDWVTRMAVHIEGKWTPLDKLVEITLTGCRSCHSFLALEHLPKLRELSLSNMDSLTCLRSSGVSGQVKPLSPSLRSLQLMRMERLEKWIDGAPNSSKMISPVLESLYISDCPKITHLDECHPHPLHSLEIYGCTGLVSIKSIQGLTSLVSLKMLNCPSFLEITNLPKECHSLKTLKILDCGNLTSLPLKMFDCFAFLNKLKLGMFSKEHSFPSLQGIEKLRNHLHCVILIGWRHWESIPEDIQHLTSLTRFSITGFGIREVPMWLTNMSSIQRLEFKNCCNLDVEVVKRGAPQQATHVTLDDRRVWLE